MTYEDLIEAVQSPTYRNSRNLETPYSALFAVLELHKPINTKILSEEYIGCDACFGWSHEGEVNELHPCETIKAIAEELA